MANKFKVGDRVRIKKTMLYNGREGVLKPASNNPEDFWDFNVELDPLPNPKLRIERARTIGVETINLEKI